MAPVIRNLVLVGATATLLLLTGCGAASDVHPGAAAVVEGEEIGFEAVDELAHDLCAVELPGLETQGAALPMSLLRTQALEYLVTEALAERYADELDLDSDQLHSRAGDLARESLIEEADESEATGAEPIPASLADELRQQRTREAFLALVLDQAGKGDLGFAATDPTTEQTVRRGNELFVAWRGDVDVTKDPRFGDVDLGAMTLVPAAGSLSILVEGSPVKSGFTDQGGLDQEYLATLPDGQRCGTPRLS